MECMHVRKSMLIFAMRIYLFFIHSCSTKMEIYICNCDNAHVLMHIYVLLHIQTMIL